jgi:hypothetical protein
MLADWSFGRRFVGAARARTTAEGWVFPSPKRATRAAEGRAEVTAAGRARILDAARS